MGSFQFNGAISGSILNTPLGDARFYQQNGQVTLASDGGQGVVTLTTATNQTATLAHSVPIGANAPSQNVTLGGRVITVSDRDLAAVLNSRSDSSLTLHSGNSGRYSDRIEAVHVQTGNANLVVLADSSGNGLATFQIASDGTMVEQNQLAAKQAAFTDQISALSVMTVECKSFVLAASASNRSITAYAVSANGTLSPTSTLGAQQFLPIATPQDMATVSFQGQNYVVLASVGTGSLTVLTLDSAGVLSPVDQVTDSLNTRLQGALSPIKEMPMSSRRGKTTACLCFGFCQMVSLSTLTPSPINSTRRSTALQISMSTLSAVMFNCSQSQARRRA